MVGRICGHCREQVAEDAHRCPHCGELLESVDPPLGRETVFQPDIGLGSLLGEIADVLEASGVPEDVMSERPPEGIPDGSTAAGREAERADQGTVFDPSISLLPLVEDDHPDATSSSADPRLPRPLARRATKAMPAGVLLHADDARASPLPVKAPHTGFGYLSAASLSDPSLSSPHFRIEVLGNEFLIRDLESADGTYVNGARIRYVELRSGDQIRAGNTVLVFRVLGDAEEPE